MLTSTKTIDQITTTENGIILYREARRIFENGTLISTTYHRWSLNPGDDLANAPAQVAAIAAVVWTPEVIAAWHAQHQDA